jgi:glycosyltransferase involved in cell wall biosynthesis
MIMEKITFLIPVYNGIEFISDSVDSILDQTYTEWELLIGVNGHPKDSKIYKKAKIMTAKIAFKENFKEQFLITSSALKSLICGHKTVDQLLCNWRYQIFGENLKQLISK